MRVRRKQGSIVVAQTGFESVAIAAMRRAGLRLTAPRVQVARALDQSERPLSAYGIHQEIIACGGKVDVVTVYRILQTMNELGLVHHIGIVDGYMACRLAETHTEESEHVVCASCGKVTELTVPEPVISSTREQIAVLGYRQQQTRVEILAVCPDCVA